MSYLEIINKNFEGYGYTNHTLKKIVFGKKWIQSNGVIRDLVRFHEIGHSINGMNEVNANIYAIEKVSEKRKINKLHLFKLIKLTYEGEAVLNQVKKRILGL